MSHYHSFCLPSQIKGLATGHTETDSSQLREYADSCFDGYPSEDKSKCILRGDKDYGRDQTNLGQIPDPIGPNCAIGERSEKVQCLVCKEGFVVNIQTGQCIKVTTEPEGCSLTDGNGKCTGCNYFNEWLPYDSEVTSCYKLKSTQVIGQNLEDF